jgi:hypothetical protein
VRTGATEEVACDYFFSTMPLKHVIGMIRPHPTTTVTEVAEGLQYRDFLTVGLLLSRLHVQERGHAIRSSVPDNWIYIQQGDPMMFPDGVNLNYGEAPDLLTAKIGGGGLPSTPFSPNQSSPGEENGLSPVGQQDLEIKSVKEINQSAEMGVNGLVNPAKSSQLGKVTVLATDRNVLVQGARPGGEAPKSNS